MNLHELGQSSEKLGYIIQQARDGDADAQFFLGACYDEGFGLAQNYYESMVWFRKAAAQGHAAAQCSIGFHYATGHGAPRNYSESRAWFRKAADQGHAKAQFNLGLLSLNGQGAPRNCVEAAEWFRKAADQGHADSQVLLGGLFIVGTGVPKDYAEASRWLQIAAEQGHADAEIVLKHIYLSNGGATGFLEAALTDSGTCEGLVSIETRLEDKVEFLSHRDALTGILDRRAMLQALQAEIDLVRARERVAARVSGLCLIVIGLGRSGQPSGETGFTCGDAVLCGLADRLADNLRRSDSLGRMAGEEFAVCAPGATLRHATALAQRLRQAVASEPFQTPLGPLPVTVSIGVAALQAGDSMQTLLERAQAAMSSADLFLSDNLLETEP